MNILFRFRDGRERFVDPETKSGTPASIKMAEAIERKFDLQWLDGKPTYVERGASGTDGDGPLGGQKAAILRYMREYIPAFEPSTSPGVRSAMEALISEIEADEYLKTFGVIHTGEVIS